VSLTLAANSVTGAQDDVAVCQRCGHSFCRLTPGERAAMRASIIAVVARFRKRAA
jgi:hypothetical protein